jgi:hypothetical protein
LLARPTELSSRDITLDAIVRHDIRVDSGGNLLALDNSASSPRWWNVDWPAEHAKRHTGDTGTS